MHNSGRTLIVGDVHGCADELDALLTRLHYAQGTDTLVLVGDLVARGPDSGRTISLARSSGAIAVEGNHDWKLVTWWRSQQPGYEGERVKMSPAHHAAAGQIDDENFAWLASLPLRVSLASHGVEVVHAGVDPAVALDAQVAAVVMNVRSIEADGTPTRSLDGRAWAGVWPGPAHIVFGHDARRGLQLEAHATGLDTGCCYGRALTALVLDANEPVPVGRRDREGHLVSVQAREAYCPMGDGRGAE